MSASMPIPGKRKQSVRNTAVSWGSSSEASSYSRTPGTSFTPGHGRTPSNIDKGKYPAVSPTPSEPISPRRPSLMGMRAEQTNERKLRGDADEVLRDLVLKVGIHCHQPRTR